MVLRRTEGAFANSRLQNRAVSPASDAGYECRFGVASRDHSSILIRVNPEAAKDKGEIRLLFA